MTTTAKKDIETKMVKGRIRFVGAARRFLEDEGYLEVQTPVLHRRLGGFEKGVGFTSFSSSLGERLWFRAAPELYLKRLLAEWNDPAADKIFELAVCMRDEWDEHAPWEGFDRPEFTLLEVYTKADDHWSLEKLLHGLAEQAIARLESEKLIAGEQAKDAVARLHRPWERKTYAELLRTLDPAFELETLLRHTWAQISRSGGDATARQAKAIQARAEDARLRDACAELAYQSGRLAPYLRVGPQGYWYDFLDHAFRMRIAPTLKGPVLVHGLPLESSPLAESEDGVHCQKWELYVDGLRVALAQRVRFQHLDHLRRLGYDLLPEPDETFIDELGRWPAGRPLIGMGVYVDRLAGSVLGIVTKDGTGQERMLPNLFK
ncbi:MAG: hypothetical protein HY261_02905 [Chloroflexi bacterium]|nr:hypothetical protein [Chloroflexota bacterium]